MNLDTGAAVNTCSWNFGPDGEGDGWFCRAASGECILGSEAWQFQGYDENGVRRSLNGRLTRNTQYAVLEKLLMMSVKFSMWIGRWIHDSSAQQNWQGSEDTMRKCGELERKTTARGEVNRNPYCRQVPAVGKRIWQSSALVYPTKTVKTDLVMTFEPAEVPREDVAMEADEDEE